MMQLVQENNTVSRMVKDFNMCANVSVKDVSSSNLDVKEKRSSNASLRLMNPVASGDNVTTGLNSAHKFREELPPLMPCCEGRQLRISEDLVRTGLSAISVKHDGVIHSLSMSHAFERMAVPPGLVKHRNSFRCLHRPDLKRVPYLRRMTPDELEALFRDYAAELPAFGNTKQITEKVEERTKPIPPDENNKAKSTLDDVEGYLLHAIPETKSGTEDVPAGMRLHGARATLYTSVLAGAKTGDQAEAPSTNEESYHQVHDEIIPEDEVQLNEELQIILPPRCDDTTNDHSYTTSIDMLSN